MRYNYPMKKIYKIFLITVLATIILASIFAGCTKEDNKIYNNQYTNDASYDSGISSNQYEVKTFIADGYKVYQPQVNTEWVFIFYLGTAMSVNNYDEILTKVASHGISVVVSDNKIADLGYKKEEKAFFMFDCKNYIIGGHSQGGGAAIRRAKENMEIVKACVLLSPMISNSSSLKDSTLPVLFFEAENDKILSSEQKNEAKSRMNDKCQYVLLEGANHMCYGESNLMSNVDGENTRDKKEIQLEITSEIISFLDGIIKSVKTN